MFPQRTLLTRPIRVAIMCTMIALFCIISPLVILYTAGYRYDVSTKKILQTGVISIDILPRDAHAFLNNVVIARRIPIRLTNRAPGIYALRFEREGYHPWSNTIEVGSNQTTYIRDVTLFRIATPRVMDTSPTLTATSTTVYPTYRTDHYLVHQFDDQLHEIGIFLGSTSLYTPLIRTTGDSLKHIVWSPFTNHALVMMTSDTDTIHTYFINATNNVVSPVVESDTIPTYYFSPNTPERVYLQIQGIWYEITQDGKAPIALFDTPDAVRIPSPTASEEWYIQESSRLLRHPQTSSTLALSHEVDMIRAIYGTALIAQQGTDILLFRITGAEAIQEESIPQGSLIAVRDVLYIVNPWSITRVAMADGATQLLLRTSDQLIHVAPLALNRPELVLTTASSVSLFDPRFNIMTTLIEHPMSIQGAVVHPRGTSLFLFGTIGQQTGMFELVI